MNFPSNLNEKLEARRFNETLRSLPRQNDLIDFSSNDYLGFSRSELISNQVMEEMKTHDPSVGSSGSRLLSGNFDFHEALEIQLAGFFQAEAALLFNSGYDANIGLLSSVPQRGDSIFYDEFSHASIRDGIRLSNAKNFGFKHNDLNDLRNKIERTSSEGEAYVIVESVYSMDGDSAPLRELVDLSIEMGFKLIVDEAHSTGIYGSLGQGMVVEKQLESFVFARIHTFGKALGCHGATVVGSQKLIQYLINFARSFIYTTAMPLFSVLTIKYAILALAETNERELLNQNISFFRERITALKLDDIFIKSSSPIQSSVFDSPKRVKELSVKLRDHNFDAKSILSPTVPLGKERIRFCIHSYNTSSEIQEVLFLLSTFV
ncbi:8-amino-7-oxononanoate synthase [Lutimonas vermicola]|uniref:8-amino-7-oxononanoate synthase n=1 Tax=Lutimonas vermicola TaxID=414288 RepID=A0ABU9L0I7_9FLAO